MRYLLIGLSIACACGCAGRTPAERTPAVAVAGQPPPVAAPPTATSPAAAATAQPAQPEWLKDVNPDMVKKGYKVAYKNGEVVYCRRDALTGTRFKSQVCLTEAQIKDMENGARKTLNGPAQQNCSSPFNGKNC